ncbi:hypothetical protein KZQ05_002405 [Listeria monocytogenes]|uniref:hypothetical protein n=1 Tax=Listeria TaxID=1637 RepID=UPI000874B098|nr:MULTISPECIES: hypothetical protein [Listeria]EAD1860365.1 hypothetical protein [Listeria monocytogenes]EAD9589818.1 hypothetical protein [Listeria monocytogenes]EAE4431378.1 hypothetical protein [Listeria monocytogenes]EAE6310392.1 hypothetical protein [Listeria monocytogenes]EAE8764606.1 hypothetical protein [Listeria monocytogenes]
MQTIVSLAILGIVAFIGYWAKDLPGIYKAITVENKRKFNELDIQRESFFRQLRGDDLAETFGEWVTAFTNMDKLVEKGPENIVDMQKRVLMYGSPKTVAILAMMFQHTYIGNQIEGEQDYDTQEPENYKLMVYIAYLIAALKFDFTGYKIDPMDIVRVRITDYKENETQFKENQQKIETEIQKCGYEL